MTITDAVPNGATTPMWMVHAACGHCPIVHGAAPSGERCNYTCHAGVECAPQHAVAASPKPAGVPGYQARCSGCGNPVDGSLRTHQCGTRVTR